MTRKFQKTLMMGAAVSLLALGFASSANAAGFQLKEQGAELQGLSFAGATARADDLSTIFYNPAGMTRLDGNQAQLNVSMIRPSAEFNVTSATAGGGGAPTAADGDGGDAGGMNYVPSIYGLWSPPEHEDLRFGLAINTPFGLTTEYSEGWVGRYYALESELQTINIAPSVGYKLDSNWSIGAGVQLQYAYARLTSASNYGALGAPDGKAVLEGDDIGFGFNLGAMYEYDEDTRVGVSYRSQVKHNLKGFLRLQGVPGAVAGLAQFQNSDIEAELITPDVLSIGGYHAIDDQWAVLGELAWTQWSVFNQLTVQNTGGGLTRQDVDEDWEDTFFMAVGTEYTYDDDLKFQFGVAYDQAAAPEDKVTFRIPDADRTWVSAGVLYDIDDNQSINVGYTHIFVDDISVTEDDIASAGTVSGDYDSSVDILAVNYNYKF